MYGKIFDSIYDGTLAEDWRALITFQQLIVLCDADGTVDMTPGAIARRTGIPLEHITAGLEILESPDPYSRTPGDDGRRIMRLDEHRPWGWYLVNHEKYRTLQDSDTVRAQNRERKRRQRERQRAGAGSSGHTESRSVTLSPAESRHTDTNTDTDKKAPPTEVFVDGKPSIPPCPHEEIIALYHEVLPELRRVRVWNGQRRKLLRRRWVEDAKRRDLNWWRRFFEYVRRCSFLMGTNGKWVADLEWLVRPDNMVKVIEGKYEDRVA